MSENILSELNPFLGRITMGDCIEVLKTLPDNSVDSIIADPPAGIKFLGKEWDSFKKNTRSKGWACQGKSGGEGFGGFGKKLRPAFCGQNNQDLLAFQDFIYQVFSEAIRVLKPGGYALIWAIPRTSHHTAMGIERAGFEIRDKVYFVFGSGFPKSLNIGKALDKKPEVLLTYEFKNWLGEQIDKCGKTKKQINDECGFTATSYRKTDGKDYWSSNFPTKTKWEIMKKVIGLSDKYDFIIRDNTEQRGFIEPTGNLHKGSGNSIKFSGKQLSNNQIEYKQWGGWGTSLKPAVEEWILARKPLAEKTVAKNVLKWGTGGLNIDGCRIKTNDNLDGGETINKSNYVTVTLPSKPVRGRNGAEIGGRFPSHLILDGSEEVEKCFPNVGKSTGGRIGNKGSPLNMTGNNYEKGDPGYGDSGSAFRFFQHCPITKEDLEYNRIFYGSKASKRERNIGGITNIHPTVKSLSLMRYLCRLITPPKGIVLDMFAGSGSTLIAAKQEGFNFIGIEREEDYCKIAEARLKATPTPML